MATVTDLAARLAAARERADALSVELRAARNEQNRLASLLSFATDDEWREWLRENDRPTYESLAQRLQEDGK